MEWNRNPLTSFQPEIHDAERLFDEVELERDGIVRQHTVWVPQDLQW